MVNDEQAEELKKLLHYISFVKSVEEEQTGVDAADTKYVKIKKILDKAKGKELFKDIQDPVEWQKISERSGEPVLINHLLRN